jgi:hypothetical protein
MKFNRFIFIFILFILYAMNAAFPCFQKLADNPDILSEIEGISIRRISGFCADHDGNLIVGTSDHGIFYNVGQKWYQLNDTNGLSGNCVHALICDTRGCVWAGTASGLNRIEAFYDPILKIASFEIKKIFAQEEKFKDNTICALDCDDHYLYIGTYQGFFVCDFSGNVIEFFNQDHSMPANRINAIHCIGDGACYIGTPKGLLLYNQGNLTLVDQFQGTWITAVCSTLHSPRQSAGTFRQSVHNRKKMESFQMAMEGTVRESNQTDKMTQETAPGAVDLPDVIYVGTNEGLYSFDYEDDTSINKSSDLWTRCLATDPKGNAWLGGKNGIVKCLDQKSFLKPLFKDLFKQLDHERLKLKKNNNQGIYNTFHITSIGFDINDRFILAIEGLGLYFIDVVNINHDAAFHASIRSQAFELTTEQPEIPQKIKDIFKRFIKRAEKHLPGHQFWEGKLSHLNDTDFLPFARYIKANSHPVCVRNLYEFVLNDPYILIPYKTPIDKKGAMTAEAVLVKELYRYGDFRLEQWRVAQNQFIKAVQKDQVKKLPFRKGKVQEVVFPGQKYVFKVKAQRTVVGMVPQPALPGNLKGITWIHPGLAHGQEKPLLKDLFLTGKAITLLEDDQGPSLPSMTVEGMAVDRTAWIIFYDRGKWVGGKWALLPVGINTVSRKTVGDAYFENTAHESFEPLRNVKYYFTTSSLQDPIAKEYQYRSKIFQLTWPKEGAHARGQVYTMEATVPHEK